MSVPGPTPDAKTESRRASGGASAPRPAQRAYPKPPGLVMRFIWLCLRPESWAEAARYPTHVTLVPLILAILLGAGLATVGQTYREARGLGEFAATYDQNYPPMELSSEGVLSVQGELKGPVRVPVLGKEVLVDPTGKTNLETVAWGRVAAVVNDKNVVVRGLAGGVVNMPLTELAASGGPIQLPEKGAVKAVNGKTIGALVEKLVTGMVVLSPLWVVAQALREAVWAAVMVFLMIPVVVMVASVARADAGVRMLVVPRRVALRMVAGYLVPLVVAGGVMRGAGYSLGAAGAWDLGVVFWMGVSLGLAVWTGLLARQMYGGKGK